MQVLGTPTETDLRAMKVAYTRDDLPKLRPYPWHRLFPKHTPPDALDFIGQLLCFSPEQRCSAPRAREHAFFDETRVHEPRIANALAAARRPAATVEVADASEAHLSNVVFEQGSASVEADLRRVVLAPLELGPPRDPAAAAAGQTAASDSGGASASAPWRDELASRAAATLKAAAGFEQPLAAAVEAACEFEESRARCSEAAADKVAVHMRAVLLSHQLRCARERAAEVARVQQSQIQELRTQLAAAEAQVAAQTAPASGAPKQTTAIQTDSGSGASDDDEPEVLFSGLPHAACKTVVDSLPGHMNHASPTVSRRPTVGSAAFTQ